MGIVMVELVKLEMDRHISNFTQKLKKQSSL